MHKGRAFKVTVVIAAAACLLATNGCACYLFREKGLFKSVGTVEVKGKVLLPDGVPIKPQDLSIDYRLDKSAKVSPSGDFKLSLNNSATALLQATDQEGNVVLEAIAPKDKLIPEYELELSPRTSALTMLFLTPGIITDDPVEALLILNALHQGQGAGTLADLISGKMKEDPSIISEPDDELKQAAAGALASFLQEASRNAPEAQRRQTVTREEPPPSIPRAVPPLGAISTGELLTQEGGGSWGPVELEHRSGGDLKLDPSLSMEGSELQEGTELDLSWTNPVPRWVLIYNDPSSEEGGADPKTPFPLTAALPRNWKVPGIIETALLILKTASLHTLLYRLLTDDLSQYKEDWREYAEDNWREVKGERKFTYDSNKPYLDLYTFGGIIPEGLTILSANRQQAAAGLTTWHLFINPLVGLLADIRLDKTFWEKYEVIKKFTEVLPEHGEQIDAVGRSLSENRYLDAVRESYDLATSLAGETGLIKTMASQVKDRWKMTERKAASMLTKALLKTAGKGTWILALIEAVPNWLTFEAHKVSMFRMMLSEENYGCYQISEKEDAGERWPGFSGQAIAILKW